MSEKQDIRKELLGTLLQSLQGEDSLGEEKESSREKESYGEEYIVQLKDACNNFLKKEFFQVGQLVKWKENLNNRKLPSKNQPAIVVAVLDEPIISSEEESGSPYFLETLDIVLGVLVDNNTFLTFYYDSRRFEAY
ncbi:hypothetical protein NDI37_24525 [Funiculus sociatus GB2-A5]|uniref:Uncharacterized protein n=1 Tax=Funiculus sociatus GB2-A5 TaxID=2933946 RepID=A0ABV0JVW9_9CYAN|nr:MULTISPECIES: hypothetical protein [unclassified Trichocoleus]MBD1907142.1 hypothetical protein [Trichocoleus sp. FACHB-832]MBD2062163.1 hypothetical protein [Trichocoleus sp. FACHB-6]